MRQTFAFVTTLALGLLPLALEAAEPPALPSLASLEKDYPATIRPILKQFCFECHSGETTEAEIDLGLDATPADVRKHLKAWIKVRAMLESRQMPPKDAKQPSEAERLQMDAWVRGFLTHEAQARAGDPGPVVLRRLNNSEYAYTIRDLSGVASLDPTSEFPVDGGSGEGFTNTGNGQGMSPALVQKYLDAAKSVAAHAVLTPEGIRFSPFTTRRDHTDELMAKIQAFYRQYTEDGGGASVDLQGVKFDTNQGGRLPLRRYLAATIAEREALQSGAKSIEQVAKERSLSPRYLASLWNVLQGRGVKSSPLMDPIREAWKKTTAGDGAAIAAQIEASHKLLWKFNPVGQIGRAGGSTAWMEPLAPFVAQQEIRLPLPDAARGQEIAFYLSAGDLGDGRENDVVVWQRPRIEFKPVKGVTRPPILLRDLRWFAGNYEKMVAAELAKTGHYLQGVRALAAAGDPPSEVPLEKRIADEAKARGLDSRLLERWVRLIGLTSSTAPQITGQFKASMQKVGGNEWLNGWGSSQTPVMFTNKSNADIQLGTLTIPARGVTIHPSPSQEAYVAWKSPIEAEIRISGKIADSDNKCGNGATWRIELASAAGKSTLASGDFESGKGTDIPATATPLRVKPGDVLSVIVGPKNRDHSCDTTHIVLQIKEVAGQKRTWDLANEVVDRILESNPLPDSLGNRDVWHFGALGEGAISENPIPLGSSLALWREAARKGGAEAERMGEQVQLALVASEIEKLAEPDRKLRELLLAGNGPLAWVSIGSAKVEAGEAGDSPFGLDGKSFGRAPDGSPIEAASLAMAAPQVMEVKIPGRLLSGGELVATVSLHPTLGKGGSVQVAATTAKPEAKPFSLGTPILASAEGGSPLVSAVEEFRDLFPPTLAYARIVPVDEVVTLLLYYREDHLLRKLMLDDRQAADLDRLWDELFFVAQEPIALSVSFEQLAEFATQDRPDIVQALKPLRKPLFDRADEFRKRLVATEPVHLDAVLKIADQAWRRPVTPAEQKTLRDLYAKLRASDLAHEDAIKLLLARVLTSPAFLYKLEQPAAGKTQSPIADLELAARLSYFLSSSAPDEELRRVAQEGKLRDEAELVKQAKRLLAAPSTRRMAVEFACQWLHVRDFDRNNDKNEKLFPEFAKARADMYEETVLFCEDLFRRDGSILSLIDADHTFLNESLAKHYGITGVTGPEWRRVEGMRGKGRGGLLGMATILASQSGASRTSPILRGNWVYETILGEKLPRPPADVPRLPDEAPTGLTERQLIEKHSSVASCAKCHVKIDPYGFALEQFDPIGRIRPQPIDVKTKLLDGKSLEGLQGLKDYLQTDRRNDFVRQFCRKLLGYALGRETQLSDEPLLEEMRQRLAADGYRFQLAVELVVRSRQFREIRGQSWEE